MHEVAPAGRKLRIGILLDSDQQPAWCHEIVAQIQRSAFAEVVLVVENGAAAAPDRGLFQRLRGISTEHLLYNAYSRLDRLVAREATAFAPRDLRPLLGRCARLRVAPIQGKFTDRFGDEDLAGIAGHDLDVLLRFGFRILKGGILTAARQGVWSYHHDDNRVVRGGPAAFHEVMRGDETSGCVLQQLSEDLDNGRILDRAVLRTVQGSVRRNQEHVFWKSTVMVGRKLEELWRTGTVTAEADDGRPRFYDRPLYKLPVNQEMAAYLVGFAGRRAAEAARRLLFVNEWNLAYRVDPAGPLADTSFHRYRRLVPPPGKFWADPCPLRRDGRTFLFFEEYDYAAGRGHIAVLALDARGEPGPARVALRRPYHVAYPFLFHHQGQLFMIPDTCSNQSVELYRCRRFPDQWELETTLFQGICAADATVHRQDDTWYLFLGVRTPGALDHDELHVHWAEDPRGPWHPVGNNPVKSDVLSSRPAGPLVRAGGKLYRPAQRGAPRYGCGITLNEVVTLSRERYQERPVDGIAPGWAPELLGVHTLAHRSADGQAITAIDLLARTPRLARAAGRLGRLGSRALAAIGLGPPAPVPAPAWSAREVTALAPPTANDVDPQTARPAKKPAA